MAKHSDGRQNWSLSGPAIAILVALIVVIAAVIAYFVICSRGDTSATGDGPVDGTQCQEGELDLPVTADSSIPSSVVEDLLTDFNDSNPVSRDHCVTATAVDWETPGALYLLSGSRESAVAELSDLGRVPSSSAQGWTDVAEVRVGVASTQDPDQVTLDSVTLPVASNDASSAAAALALADDDEEAALSKMRADSQITLEEAFADPQADVVVREGDVPEGRTFHPIDGASVPIFAVPTNAAGGINEEQSRAGSALADFLAAQAGENDSTATDTSSLLTRYQDPDDQASVDQAEPANTLIMLDTSNAMAAAVPGSGASYHDAVASILATLSTETGGQGNQVALYNYSSPLNPGVTRGWRPNVTFPDDSAGANAAAAVSRFGTGGIPLTRPALITAATVADEWSSTTGEPVRVVLVTSGTADTMSDENLRTALDSLGGGATLHVVHVGDGAPDQALADWAVEHGGSADTATDESALGEALRSAFGL